MATLAEKLQAEGLPFERVVDDSRVECGGLAVTPAQQARIAEIIDEHIDPVGYATQQRMQARYESALPGIKSIPSWATWTVEEFNTWCDGNLMTDVQIDATALGLDIKRNMKANNAFVRNAGRVLIALRDEVWRGAASE